MNKQILLAARPVGFPKESDFRLVETPLREPGIGEFRVRIQYVSVDPYMRGRMNDVKSYVPPFEIGGVVGGGSVGQVDASNHPKFPVGSYASGMFGWQLYAISDGKGVVKVDPSLTPVTLPSAFWGCPG